MKISMVFLLAALALAAPCLAAENGQDVYFCPMHPQVVSDKAGECPICHMRLVRRDTETPRASGASAADSASLCKLHDCPMEKAGIPCPMLVVGQAGETVECPYCREKIAMAGGLSGTVPAGYASVLISPEKQQLIGIRTAKVQKKPLTRSLRTVARVGYDPELYQAQIDYLREYRTSLGTLRSRELTFRNLSDSRWEAPRVEIAKSKLILKGMDDESIQELVDSAKADEALLYLKPDGPVWIFAEVFETEAHWLRKGDRVLIEVPGVPEKKYEGTIHSIGSIVEAETRRVHVHVRLQNDGFLKPEMFLNATLLSTAGEGLTVPAEAVFFTGRAAVVFADKGKGLFEPRQVETGIQAGEEMEIRRGLSEGENVVANGNFLLDSESRLKASIEQAAAAHAGHGGGHD